jgi:hypothetical protein
MTNERNTALAYDPIANEDVEIDCRGRHERTDYENIDGSELPVLIDQDFRHDPVEGCQGTFTEIIEIDEGCPNCGYDRADHSGHTLAGVYRTVCRACGVDITDSHKDGWTPSKRRSRAHDVKKDGEFVIGLWPAGDLYRRDETYIAVNGDRAMTLGKINELANITRKALKHEAYDEDLGGLNPKDAARLIREAMQFTGGDDDAE